VVEDLDEEFRSLAARAAGDASSLGSARRWYRSQVLRSLWPALACRLRRRRTASPRGVRGSAPSEPLSGFIRGVRLAARSLARTPGFTGLTLLMLVIGVAASAAAFSVVDAVLLRPLPYRDADRIVYLYGSEIEKENLAEVEGTLTSFASVAVHGLVDVDVHTGDAVARASAMPVSERFFEILGSTPALGRPFVSSDHAAGAPPVALITHRLAALHFGDARRAIGEPLTIDGRAFTVVGVMPPGFTYLRHASADIWLPAVHSSDRTRSVIARLSDGATIEGARAEAVRIARRLEGDARTAEQDASVDVERLADSLVAFSRGRIQMLMAVVALVLLVSCANVANLFLARNARRAQELSIRRALGAHRRHLAGQILLEGAVLAALAAVLGTTVGLGVTRVLLAAQPEPLAGVALTTLSWRVAGFAAGLSGLSVVLFGALPGAAIPHGALAPKGGRGDAPAGLRRLRDALVVGQVLVSTLLFIASALFLRSYDLMAPPDPGFEWRDRLAFRVELPERGYADPVARQEFFDQLLGELERLPGVLSVSAASDLPLTRSHFSVEVPRAPGPPSEASMVLLRAATPTYLSSMGVQVLRGRRIEQTDRADTQPVAVINPSMAEYLWPGSDPLGRFFEMSTGTREAVTLQVVGVIADGWLSARRGGSRPEVFVPYAQERGNALAVVLHARSLEGLSPAVVDAVRRLDPRVPVLGPNREFGGPGPLAGVISDALAPWRYQASLVGIFAALALVLTAGGMYGVLSFDVTRRSHEMGVRLALGARPVGVARLVMRKGMRLVLAGLAGGMLLALAAGGVLSSFLFGVGVVDPMSYLAAAAAVSLVGLVTTWLPARRASDVDPSAMLRRE
jgi:putative ABC transport system permease protein